MARLILKSPYIKSTGGASGYLRYIATRERVEMIPDDRPPTRKQEQLIAKLVKDFPDSKDSFEYEDYLSKPTKVNASAFISLALESNWDRVRQAEGYMKYIASRPRAERISSHGLFGDADNVDLDLAMHELESYTGNVWTHIVSLKREDAARLGYDNARAWRDLIRAHRNDIAAAMKIPPNDFRWYAAFHDEGKHPHIHMMAWSAKPGQAYLSRDGIQQIKSKLTNDIFKQEMLHTYEQKSASRDELVQEARHVLVELAVRLQNSYGSDPFTENLMQELSALLETVKGKQSYGYLPKAVKRQVDKIVDMLERFPTVSQCYEKWMALQDEVDGYYTGRKRERVPLSQQKEFRAIKNAVIHEAERIRLNIPSFEDASIEYDDESVRFANASAHYQNLKEIIYDTNNSLEERDGAVAELRKYAESGYVPAQYLMAKLYHDGGLLTPDSVLEREWLTLAAEQGSAVSQYALGKLLLTDDVEVHDPESGLHWLEKAAENGWSYAAYRLGKEYLTGKHVTKNVERAVHYFEMAANADNPYAQYMLGKLYLSGDGVEQSIDLAMAQFEKSAAHGNIYAQMFLDRKESLTPPPVLLSVTRLLYHAGRVFQENSLPRTRPDGLHIDKKRMRKLMEKCQALGVKGAPELKEDESLQMRGY